MGTEHCQHWLQALGGYDVALPSHVNIPNSDVSACVSKARIEIVSCCFVLNAQAENGLASATDVGMRCNKCSLCGAGTCERALFASNTVVTVRSEPRLVARCGAFPNKQSV